MESADLVVGQEYAVAPTYNAVYDLQSPDLQRATLIAIGVGRANVRWARWGGWEYLPITMIVGTWADYLAQGKAR